MKWTPQDFLAKARELGYIEEGEMKECRQIHEELQSLGYQKSIDEVTLTRQVLTEYQIEQVKEALAKSPPQKEKKKKSKKAKKKKSADKTTIPGYKVLKKLGQGGMGTVYQGLQTSLERKVAIKVLSPELSREDEYISRISREAKTLGRLNHPNIVTAYDFGSHKNFHYLVMEFVDGTSLDEPLRQGKTFSEEEALEIMAQIARALQEAQENNLIHRDIKPGNIMLDSKGVAKLCDLGLAKQIEVQEDGHVTIGKATLGTPAYMSPEQARGKKDIDIRSDIYSLGATFYHLVTGKAPFEAPGVGGIYAKILSDELPNPKKENPQLSFTTARLIQKMMSKDRNQRPQSPQELVEAIEKAKKGNPFQKLSTGSNRSSKIIKGPRGNQSQRHNSPSSLSPPNLQQNHITLGIVASFVGCILVGFLMIAFLDFDGSHADTSKKKKENEIVQKEPSKGNQNSQSANQNHSDNSPDHSDREGKDEKKEDDSSKEKERKEARKKEVQRKLAQIKKRFEKKEYIEGFQELKKLKKDFPSFKTQVVSETRQLREEAVEDLQKKEKQLLARKDLTKLELKDLQFTYEEILQGEKGPLASKLRQGIKRLSKRAEELDEAQKKKDREEEELNKKSRSILHFLRVWDFEKAQEAYDSMAKKAPGKLRDKLKNLPELIKEVKEGKRILYQWLSQKLSKGRATLTLKGSGKSAQKIILIDWIPEGDTLIFCTNKSYDIKIGFTYHMLSLLRKWLLKTDPKKAKELYKRPMFLLLTGDIKGAEKVLPSDKFGRLCRYEKKNDREFTALRLGYRSQLYLHRKKYLPAFYSLRLLRKNYSKTKYFTRTRTRLNKSFRTACFEYFKKEGVRALLNGKVISQKGSQIKILYHVNHPEQWSDWKAVTKQYSQSEVKVDGEKKTLGLRGQARLKVVFKGNLKVEIEAQASQKGLDGLSVFFCEKAHKANPYEALIAGLWFTHPRFGKIPVKTQRGKKLFSFPGTGIIHIDSQIKRRGNKRQIRIRPQAYLLKKARPRLRPSKKYNLTYYYQNQYVGLRIKSSSFGFHHKDNYPPLHGTFSLYSGDNYITISKIVVTGTVDEKWLAKTLNKIASTHYRRFVK